MDEGRARATRIVDAFRDEDMLSGHDLYQRERGRLIDRLEAEFALAPPGQDAGRRVVELAKVWGACVDDKSTGSMTRLIVAENNLLAAVRAWARGSEQESGDE